MRKAILMVIATLVVLATGSAFAKESKPAKKVVPQAAAKFDPSDFTACKFLALEAHVTLWRGSVAATPDVIDPLIASCEGSDCADYRQIKKMNELWQLSDNKLQYAVGQPLYDTGKFKDIYLGTFAFKNAEQATTEGMQRCAIKVDLDVEVNDLPRVEIKYELGRHFYVSESQGGYLFQPVGQRMPKLISTHSGNSSRYVEPAGVPDRISAMVRSVTGTLVKEFKGEQPN